MKRQLDLQPLETSCPIIDIHGEKYKKIRFESLISVVEQSLEDNRLWVSDFRNDGLLVTPDLHDIIRAFDHFYGDFRDSQQ